MLDTKKVLSIRTPSGLSGDMLLSGFALISRLTQKILDELINAIGFPDLKECFSLKQISINNISGWQADISLPRQHAHRRFSEIKKIIAVSRLSVSAKKYAVSAFTLLAEAESRVHAIPVQEVTFHEVGALDSLLDICLASALFDLISPEIFICSPIPVCDGTVRCEHGLLSTPVPAVLELLKGVPVYGVDAKGETITPTAIALLKALGAEFGDWPEMRVDQVGRIYGTKVIPNLPNGAIFALGFQ